MREFFSEKVGFGHYASKSVLEIFTRDRRYFDQILNRNSSFRNRYSQAYSDWVSGLKESGAGQEEIRRERVMTAVELMGEENVQGLFDRLIAYISQESPACSLIGEISFKETLSSDPPRELSKHLDLITKFWARVALPEV
ncbi:hypothetical protein REC12_03250 [Desulfosporosinus sp. PR]|uniref:hypothetical protein n=1 Tax=Candidatus Desulfosporosinus nitrosoreducens TaxID=3401928 RepID=UPI0027F87822|nr:hypothetical protein [Desulfosporosinus sp. PR]MDQ7092597.1 hypothetical protein [Desulfosporosinus sp. PR]